MRSHKQTLSDTSSCFTHSSGFPIVSAGRHHPPREEGAGVLPGHAERHRGGKDKKRQDKGQESKERY